LLAALGALGGPAFAVWTALLAGVAGGILAIGVLRSQQKLGLVVAGMASGAVSRNVPFATSNIKIPYAVAIAAGALVALVVT
jgi:Flp pilus assembly protein protease CpaA